MIYEQKDPRLLQEVGDLSLSLFTNQSGLLYLVVVIYIFLVIAVCLGLVREFTIETGNGHKTWGIGNKEGGKGKAGEKL